MIDSYSGYRFFFSTHRSSASIAVLGFMECLIHRQRILLNIAFDQGTCFMVEEMQERTQWSHHTIQKKLTSESRNNFLEAQVKCQSEATLKK